MIGNGEVTDITAIEIVTLEDWVHQLQIKLRISEKEREWKMKRIQTLGIKMDFSKWVTSASWSSRDDIIFCRIRIGHYLLSYGYLIKDLEVLTRKMCNNTPASIPEGERILH